MELYNRLPEKESFRFTNVEEEGLTEEEKNIINLCKNYVESKLWAWKKDENFVFDLPPTVFHEKKTINVPPEFQYNNLEVVYENENIAGSGFNGQILNQIWQKGEFNVNSRHQNFPYTWKLSKLIIKGIENIKLRYRKDMAIAFSALYTLCYRFSNYNYKKLMPVSFISAFYHLYLFFFKLIHLFLGLPLYDDNSSELSTEIRHEKLLEFIRNHNDYDFSIFNNQNVDKLKKLDELFGRIWVNSLMPDKIKEYKIQKLTKDEINAKLNDDKKTAFKEFLENNNVRFNKFKFDHPSIMDYYNSQQIIENETFAQGLEYEEKLSIFKKNLEKCYIKNLSKIWHDDKVEAYSKKLNNETKDAKENRIKRQIENKKEPSGVYYYNTDLDKEFDEILEQRKKLNKKPYKKYEIKKTATRPYEIEQTGERQNIHYRLIKKRYIEIKTNFFCWRVILFLTKLYCAFCNLNIFLYRKMTSSCLGIKALFVSELYTDYDINSLTGEVNECGKTFTFPRTICNLIKWINTSREEFEAAPDTGILGKSFTRLFNLFYNYIMKLLILGTLVLVFYPLFIILFTTMYFCLIILSPVLSIVWVLLDFLLCIIFNNRYGELKAFPLLRIIIVELFTGFIIQFIVFFICVIFQPIFSVLTFFYAQIHFFLRYLYDFLFYYILKCFGRIPTSDNCIAWKIAGPGLFRERYFDIRNRDIMSLVIAEIEKKVIQNYKNKMLKILEQPNNDVSKITKIFKNINFSFNSPERINSSVNFYIEKLNRDINLRNKYPVLSNLVRVKFTDERLEEVKKMVEQYITQYSELNDFSFELDKYYKRKIEQATENILSDIFGRYYYETLQESDKIVHLESFFKNDLDSITTKLFENPNFDDRKYVEERQKNIKIIRYPNFATFESIFYKKNPLNLNISLLSREETNELIIDNSDNIRT